MDSSLKIPRVYCGFRSGVLCLIVMVNVSVVFAGSNQAESKLKLIAEGYRANRAMFNQGRCEFTYAIRTANSEEDALNGNWSEHRPPLEINYILLLKGERFVVKTDVDPEEVIRAVRDEEPILVPMLYAVNGNYAIDYDAATNTAHVHSPENDHLNIRMHPFNLADDSANIDPESAIRAFLLKDREQSFMSVEKNASFNGRKYLLLKRSSDIGSHDVQHYIDPERGFLPIVTELYTKTWDQLYSRMIVTDVREHNGMYFPMRTIKTKTRMVVNDRGEVEIDNSYVNVIEMSVSDVDYDYLPTDEELSIPLHRETQFSDGINPKTAKTLFRDNDTAFATVAVGDIEHIYHGLQELAVHREQLETERRNQHELVQFSGRSTSWMFLLLAINVGCALLLAGLFYWRRKKLSSEE